MFRFFHAILVSFLSLSTFSQKGIDKKLEQYIINDEYEAAKDHIHFRLKNLNENATENQIYYNAKAGFVFLRLGMVDSAMYYSKKALIKLKPNTTKDVKCETWKSIAYSYCKYGKIDSATIYTQKLYETVENSDNLEMKRYANILMAMISFQNRLLQDCLRFYEKALEISKSSNNKNNFKVDYYNLGLTHTALKNYNNGIQFLEKAEYYALKGKDKRLLGRIYGTTADNYAAQGNNEKRLLYLDKANNVAQAIKDQKLLTMGTSHQMQWDFNNGNAISAYEKGSKLTKKLSIEKLPQLQAKNDSIMYVMAKRKNNKEEALYYLESFTKNKLKLLRENGRKQVEEIRSKYELENKNLTIQKQKIEIISTKRINKISYLIIFIFSLIFFFLGYLYLKHKKIVHLIYRKEKAKDFQINKLVDVIKSYRTINTSNPNENNKTDEFQILKDNINNDNKTFSIYEKFIEVLETNKLFLNPDLDQNTIIKHIGTNKKYLYEAINKHSDLNFRSLINRYRIDEAKKIIENKIAKNKEINFSTIFSECGFNSNSSFYRTFKTMTGITPNEYAIEYKKDIK